jgi:xylulokinase
MQADVFNQEVCTINAEEGPAYGVALLAAVGAGAYSTIEEACEATIHVVGTTPKNKESAKIYSRGFPLYQRLYKRLRKEFAAMAEL